MPCILPPCSSTAGASANDDVYIHIYFLYVVYLSLSRLFFSKFELSSSSRMYVLCCILRVYLFSFLFFRRMLLLPKDCGNIDCQIPRPPYYDMYRLVMVRGILFSVVYPSVLVCCILFGRAHHPILASRILVFNNFLCYSCRFVVYEGR